ncbi:beta-lactamase/transpeptidase-like protein [Pluteus cervinus]|uniref:Beta-lactamase/transpeptidase-like protein n=1 Tax=Pluteus cervinus TaxID=181527 RepID=A0ACD3AUJ5_9AGAR|nr:beta-lactamase/transpeptidase-like protein [Pluteus cervinus]
MIPDLRRYLVPYHPLQGWEPFSFHQVMRKAMKTFLAFSAFKFSVLVSCHQQPLDTNRGEVGHAWVTENHILDDHISTFIEATLSEWGSPGGASVVVVQKADSATLNSSDGWIIEARGYGHADLAGKIPITSDSLFSIGSNSKLFTAATIGLLISDEDLTPRVTWKTKLASLIPEWKLIDPIAQQESTILDALSHRTGMPGHDLAYENGDSIQSVFDRLQHLKPSASFRDIHQYNNMMYCVVSSLPSKLLPSRIPFARYAKKQLLDRLNLVDTTYSYDKALATGRLVQGLAREGVNLSNPLAPSIARVTPFWAPGGGEDGNYMSGAGGIISSGKDLAIWLQTLLSDGVHPLTSETVIPKAALDTISTGYSIPVGRSLYPELSPAVYGLGQGRLSYRGYEMIEHIGYDTGYHSDVLRIPSKGLGIAVLLNDDTYGGYLEKIIGYRILDQALGLEPVDWNNRFKQIVRSSASQRAASTRPSRPLTKLSVPIESLVGIYQNPGYGTIELCAFPIANTTVLSSACNALSKEVDVVLPGVVHPNKPTLVGRWNKVWSTHIVLTHFNDNLFNITAPMSMPTNDPSYPFWPYEVDHPTIKTIVAEFALTSDQGFGLSGGAWGAGVAAEAPSGDTLLDRAEIYFEKI